MPIKAGTVDSFSDSMAEAMEHALKTEWNKIKDEDLSDAGAEDRRMLFVAIALWIFGRQEF